MKRPLKWFTARMGRTLARQHNERPHVQQSYIHLKNRGMCERCHAQQDDGYNFFEYQPVTRYNVKKPVPKK